MGEETETRLRKAWRVSVKDYDDSEIVYAPTAGKARVRVWHMLDSVRSIIDIVARRAPEKDVRLPVPDAATLAIPEAERNALLHAYGADQGDPTRAGYRDYFYTYRDDPPLVDLTRLGLIKPMAGDQWGKGMTYFVLTADGKRAALSLVPEYAP